MKDMINKVFNEDCLETMNRIDDKSINLIIADFPYFEVKGDFDFIWKDFDEFLQWVEVCAKEFKRILADNGSLYVYGNTKKIAYKQIIFDKYFNLENSMVWHKKDSIQYQYYSIDLARCFNTHTERILFYSNEIVNIDGICVNNARDYIRNEIIRAKGKIIFKDVNKAIGAATNGGGVASATLSLNKTIPAMMTKEHYNLLRIWLNSSKEYEYLRKEYDDLRRHFNNKNKLEDVLFFSQESNITKNYNHPTQKSPKLTKALIETSSKENDLVYIPFGGSGTELEQCHLLNRRYIGSELGKKYCDIIEDRIKNAKGEVGLFSNELIQWSLF